MTYLPATRPLLKLLSLGLSGLVIGLLSGCHSSNPSATTESQLNNPQGVHHSGDGSEDLGLPSSLDAQQIPALRHPPSARRLEYGAVHIRQVSIPGRS